MVQIKFKRAKAVEMPFGILIALTEMAVAQGEPLYMMAEIMVLTIVAILANGLRVRILINAKELPQTLAANMAMQLLAAPKQ
jgi:hypothetical protein